MKTIQVIYLSLMLIIMSLLLAGYSGKLLPAHTIMAEKIEGSVPENTGAITTDKFAEEESSAFLSGTTAKTASPDDPFNGNVTWRYSDPYHTSCWLPPEVTAEVFRRISDQKNEC